MRWVMDADVEIEHPAEAMYRDLVERDREAQEREWAEEAHKRMHDKEVANELST